MKFMSVKYSEYLGKMIKMSLHSRTEHQYIIKEDDNRLAKERAEDFIHGGLER